MDEDCMSEKDYSVYEEPKKLWEVDEEKLERAYWDFDANVKRKNFSDRDCFKSSMRGFAREEIDRYIREQERKEIETFKEFQEEIKRELLEPNFFLGKFYSLRRWVRNL